MHRLTRRSWTWAAAIAVASIAVLLISGRVADPLEAARLPARATVLAAGNAHACAVRADGSVWCWGENVRGQLGDATNTDRSLPVKVKNISTGVAVTAGGTVDTTSFSCALLIDGTARCWGANNNGQLGNGTTSNSSTPVVVPGTFTKLSAGGQHACGIRDTGAVACWGLNFSGQLGNGDNINSLSPVDVVTSTMDDPVIDIDAGTTHTCAVDASAFAWCWGEGGAGQLGNATSVSSNAPVPVFGLQGGVVSISAGLFHSCAFLPDSGPRCWGANADGQLGTNSTTPSNVPVAPSSVGQAAIEAEGSHTCDLRALFGSVRCWGTNVNGESAQPPPDDVLAPQNVGGSGNVIELALGTRFSCALLGNGTVSCWGQNTSGQLGDGTLTTRHTRAPVLGFDHAAPSTVSAGRAHTCFRAGDGDLSCTGLNADGQLGDGTTDTPKLVPGPVSLALDAVNVDTNTFHTCATLADYTTRCWGLGSDGQLGTGGTGSSSVPVATFFNNISTAVDITVGLRHTCALLATGNVRCWGDNAEGQVGNGGGADVLAPVELTLENVIALDAGFGHTCAVLTTAVVSCWGDNGSMQLGDGTTTDRPLPVIVDGVKLVTDVAAGSDHSCALTAEGDVWCWGRNQFGQLGDGTTINRPDPTLVTGLPPVKQISAGEFHTCALLVVGELRCWGRNNQSQLADGTVLDRNAPVVSAGGELASAIDAKHDTTCAVFAHGIAKCWSANDFGQIGDGTIGADVASPSAPSIDTDGDGCADSEEAGADPNFGGDRDYFEDFDFFNVTGEDKAIDLGDTLAVLAQFGLTPDHPDYDPLLDRIAPDETKPWRTASTDSENEGVDLADALLNLQSFGHSCAAPP